MSLGASPDAPQGGGGQTARPDDEPATGAGATRRVEATRAAGASGEPEPERAGEATGATEIPRTKTAMAHNALIAGAVLLILLLVFILENTKSVNITYFGVGFHLPLGVALLLAAIAGALIVGIVGTARIMQLRRRVRRRT
jgi:uncharacterized integral membrane protein